MLPRDLTNALSDQRSQTVAGSCPQRFADPGGTSAKSERCQSGCRPRSFEHFVGEHDTSVNVFPTSKHSVMPMSCVSRRDRKGRARLIAAADASRPRDQSAERQDEPWQSRPDDGTRDGSRIIEARDEALVPVEPEKPKCES